MSLQSCSLGFYQLYPFTAEMWLSLCRQSLYLSASSASLILSCGVAQKRPAQGSTTSLQRVSEPELD